MASPASQQFLLDPPVEVLEDDDDGTPKRVNSMMTFDQRMSFNENEVKWNNINSFLDDHTTTVQ